GVWYEVITFGAPADHHQGFKHGGLKKLLSKHSHLRDSVVSYSQEESSRARELLANVAQLQPLVFGLAEELLSVSLEQNNARLQPVLHSLTQQTKQFVHALKDELVKSALIASHDHSNLCEDSTANQEWVLTPGQQDAWQQEADYDEEEWDRAWANVGMSLNCIIAMGDRLLGKEEVTSSGNQESDHSQNTASWQEQLLPLVVTLRDCVREAELKARVAMTFVMMQAAAAMTVSEGTTNIVQRRHAAFSQALSALVCGFVLRLFSALQDQDFLQQLISAGLLVQFEALLSTYGEEVGMLEDMEVCVSDLSRVTFTIIEAKSEEPEDLLPTLRGEWVSLVVEVPLPPETFRSLPQEVRDGRLIRVHPVLFNIGINQQQSLAERFGDSSLQERVNQQSCERLRVYCNTLRDTLPVTGTGDLLAIMIPEPKGREVAALLERNVTVTMTITIGTRNLQKYVSRTSVVFVSISFIVLMIISLAWLVFYYIQRFRYANARDLPQRRLGDAAKKAISKLQVRTIRKGDQETEGDFDNCAVCIEGYKPNDVVRILPCRHLFHKSCVDPWLLDHRTCPMCKMNILKALGIALNADCLEDLPLDYDLTVGGVGGALALEAVVSGGSSDGTLSEGGGSSVLLDPGVRRVGLPQDYQDPLRDSPVTMITDTLTGDLQPMASSSVASLVITVETGLSDEEGTGEQNQLGEKS
ncbi:type II inositol 3,4-bisphosphate 4-phosphatase-like, partial [Notothenia coriiceps]|uniref:Type II inositol 3,4-bisphosphate 4-phosphatase-like n=1 Tax=Notothenia coriiceps TaxID=8208 RepID=A0A6I9NQH1_9TELE